ncbi:MAG: hypothetical protein LLG37_09150 [Spirochaetia bacterium]|nr:hypothetical protein [Spirochaetia bacterium]
MQRPYGRYTCIGVCSGEPDERKKDNRIKITGYMSIPGKISRAVVLTASSQDIKAGAEKLAAVMAAEDGV